jgi:hypothetical protein
MLFAKTNPICRWDEIRSEIDPALDETSDHQPLRQGNIRGGQFGLRLGQGGGDGTDRWARAVHGVKTDRPGFGALGSEAMADGLPGVLRHQLLQLGLGPFMRLMGGTGPAVGGGKGRPELLEAPISTIRTASRRGSGRLA